MVTPLSGRTDPGLSPSPNRIAYAVSSPDAFRGGRDTGIVQVLASLASTRFVAAIPTSFCGKAKGSPSLGRALSLLVFAEAGNRSMMFLLGLTGSELAARVPHGCFQVPIATRVPTGAACDVMLGTSQTYGGPRCSVDIDARASHTCRGYCPGRATPGAVPVSRLPICHTNQ